MSDCPTGHRITATQQVLQTLLWIDWIPAEQTPGGTPPGSKIEQRIASRQVRLATDPVRVYTLCLGRLEKDEL